jgi:hypothetical protein
VQTTTSANDSGTNIITVTLTDGTKTTFNVKNGSKGNAGVDGTSVTVKSVNGNNTDGGSNIVTFSDGKTLTIKNGSKGSQGIQGPKGDTGPAGTNGKDGISATHSWDGTTLTITSASGTSSANLKGNKGDTGPQGDIGYYIKATVDRPKKFTEAEWAQYGEIGHNENWGSTDNTGFREGDLFIVVGTSIDAGQGHMLIYSFYKDSPTRTTLHGTCLGHHIISAKGAKGDTGTTGPQGPAGSNGTSATHTWENGVLTINSASGLSIIDINQMLQEKLNDIPMASSKGAIF